MVDMSNVLPLDLQLFAEGAEPDDAGAESAAQASEGATEKETPKETPKTYTDADVDKIVAQKLARAHAKAEAEKKKEIETAVKNAQEEAAKLAKMNEEQKKQYEDEKKDRQIKKYQEQIAQLQKDALKGSLAKQATSILSADHQITATQDMLDFVVGEDGETTKANIDKLVRIINADREAQELKRARGTTPLSYSNDKNKLSAFDELRAKYKTKK